MTLAEVFALLAFIVSLLLTIVRTAPFLISIIDVSTRIVKHRKALLSVGFCGILVCRKGAVLQVQRSCFPSWGHRCVVPLEEVQFFVALRGYECFYT